MSQFVPKLVKANLLKRKRKSLLMILTIAMSAMVMFCAVSFFLMIQNASSTEKQWDYHYMIKNNEDDLNISYSGYEEAIEATTNLYIKSNNNINGLHYLSPFAYYIQDEADLDTQTSIRYLFEIEGDARLYSAAESKNMVVVSKNSGYGVGDIIEFEILHRSNSIGNKNQFGEVIDLKSGDYEIVETKQYTVGAIYIPTKELEAITGGLEYNYTLDDTYNQEYYHFIRYSSSDTFPSAVEIADALHKDINDIYTNEATINQYRISNILSQLSNLLSVFGAIFIIMMIAIFATLNNIFLVSDEETKIEFGILKSIGTKNATLKKIVLLELFVLSTIGSFIGTVCGMGLVELIHQLIATSEYGVMMNQTNYGFIIIFSTMLLSILITMITGLRYHRKIFKTYPIEDFRKRHFFQPPVKMKSIGYNSAIWRLFFIYNTRIKKQTKNLFRAFLLLMVSGLLFGGTLIFNAQTRTEIKGKANQYDLAITFDGYSELFFNEELVSKIYDYFETENANQVNHGLKRLFMKRELLQVSVKNEHGDVNSKTILYLYDDKQLKEVCEYYQIQGKCTDLEKGELIYVSESGAAIGIIYEQETAPGTGVYTIKVPKIGDNLTLSYYSSLDIFKGRSEEKDALIAGKAVMSSSEDKNFIYILDQYTGTTRSMESTFRKNYYIGHINDIDSFAVITSCQVEGGATVCYAFSKESEMNTKLFGAKNSNVNYKLMIELENVSTHTKVAKDIRDIMLEIGVDSNTYHLEDMIDIVEQTSFAIFIAEVVAYPLFVLLVLVFALNLLIATIGHIETKKQDMTIFKSVGASNKQLHKLILFEYLEAFINSAVITFIVIAFILVGMEIILGENFFYNLGVYIGIGWFFSIAGISSVILIFVLVNAYRLVNKIPSHTV